MRTSYVPPRPPHYFLEMRSSEGQISKEYVNGTLRRLEVYVPSSDRPQLHIYRLDKGVSWTAMPGSTTLREFTYSADRAATIDAMNSLIIWSLEGSAVIDGCECLRFIGRYQIPAGKAYEESY